MVALTSLSITPVTIEAPRAILLSDILAEPVPPVISVSPEDITLISPSSDVTSESLM